MATKKALIISYYWPPSGGAGVQRWLKFSKYLPSFGWTPVVYVPANPHYPVLDESLSVDIPASAVIVKHPIWEPYSFYKKLMGMKKEERVQHGFIMKEGKSAWKQKISTWIRGNFFIPDARKFWIKSSIRFLTEYLKEHPVDVIISTGPPHSMHLIAEGVKAKTGLPWLADFRDLWTEIDFYDQLMLTKWADAKHRRLEQKVMRNADLITTVNWDCKKCLQRLGAQQVEVITNGYDETDVQPAAKEKAAMPKFEILHVGSMNKDRNPTTLWKVLKELAVEVPGFKEALRIKLIGSNDFQVISDIEHLGLKECLELPDYMPHSEVYAQLTAASVLLLALNNTPNVDGITPGKMFEYLSAKRPILVIGSTKGDAAKIISMTKAGSVYGFEDHAGLKEGVLQYYKDYQNGQLNVDSGGIEQFSRKNLTKVLVKGLDRLTKSTLTQ